jgi:ABC-2 type transport system permease protein
MVILLGTNTLLLSFFEGFFFEGCMRLSEDIRKGDLDFLLLKPVNPQFLGSFRTIDYAQIMTGFAGFIIVGYGLYRLGSVPSLSAILLFLWLLIVGIAIYYGLMFSIATLTFWMGRSNNLFDLYWQLGQFGRYPGEIYRFGLRVFLMTALPMIVVTNFPARVLFEGLEWPWVFYATGLGLLFVTGPTWLWRKGLERYRSASS